MKGQSVRLARPARSANGRLRESADNGSLDVEIEPDPLTGTRQWFHFRAQAPDGTTIRMVDAESSTYPRGWDTALVWARAPGNPWSPLRPARTDGTVTFPHARHKGLTAYALFPPYPVKRLGGLAEQIRQCPDGEIIAADSASRRAPRFSLGDHDPAARQFWIVCGQHGGEHPALWFADGLTSGLLAMPQRTTSGKRFHIVPIANPTGMFAGHLRTTDAGQDPNRHWNNGHAEDCPEVGTLLEAMTATGVDVVLDVHTDFETEQIYLDVLDEWIDTPAPLVAVRERFEHHLAARSADFVAGLRYPWQSAPPPQLLAGMCAPAVERRFGAAAITLELPIGRFRDAEGSPGEWTPDRSRALGRAAAAVLLDEV